MRMSKESAMANRRGSLLVVSYLVVSFLLTWSTVGFRQSATELHGAERLVDRPGNPLRAR